MGNNQIYKRGIDVEMVRLVGIPNRDLRRCREARLVCIRGSTGRAENDPGTT
jgi:hypothetical protein